MRVVRGVPQSFEARLEGLPVMAGVVQQTCKVVPGFGIVGATREGVAVGRRRRRFVALQTIGIAEVVVRRCKIGLQADGFFEPVDRAIKVAQAPQDGAQIAVRIGEMRIEPARLIEGRRRLEITPLMSERRASVVGVAGGRRVDRE